MVIETQAAEIIGNIIGGLIFYGILAAIIYWLIRIAIRHDREKQKIIEMNKKVIKNGKHKG